MLRTSVLVAGVMGAMAAVASAGVPSGTYVQFTGGSSNAAAAPAVGYGIFTESISNSSPSAASATGTLNWSGTSYSFSGSVLGARAAGSTAPITATSTGIASYTFSTAMIVSVSWDLSNVAAYAALTESVGWTISDSSGNFVYGITYFAANPTPNVVGGVTAVSAHSGFTGQLGQGTWQISTSAGVDAPLAPAAVPTNGTFSVTMTFTPVPVPAPGALPLVAVASLVARRGRRR
jgi:hypothetical protein